tara:strand:+ start:144 stop:611 length:468 start_codon:yes stop_codon:yes gene_type:complete
MRILGIDPGYDRLGISILEKKGDETLVYSSCFQTDSALPFHERLFLVGERIQEVIQEFSPDHLAFENVYFNTNQKTAMDVAAVRGVLMYLARKNDLDVFEYTPPQIKSAVGGNGRASKREVQTMIHHLVDISHEIPLDDEYDAIAVALTHSACVR